MNYATRQTETQRLHTALFHLNDILTVTKLLEPKMDEWLSGKEWVQGLTGKGKGVTEMLCISIALVVTRLHEQANLKELYVKGATSTVGRV